MIDHVCSVSGAVHVQITIIQHALADVLRTPLQGEYFLDDSGWADAFYTTSAELTEIFQRLYCYRYELLNIFYKQVLLGANGEDVAGAVAEEESLPRLLYSQALEMELGGGMGGGFQLYCDGEVALTAGGGAGGGGYIDPLTGSIAFGCGAGGGAQALTRRHGSTDSYISIGGGGGCNTCDPGTAGTDIAVTCGTATDRDAGSLSQFQSSLRHLRHTCKDIVVYGGGGGGGGIVRAGKVETGAGYGYSFYLSATAGQRKEAGRLVRVDSPPAPVDIPSGTAEGSQNMHAVFYKVMNASVASCGGYANWTCVCNETLHRVQACSSISLPATAVPDCTAIRAANETIHAMLFGSCRNTDNRNSEIPDRCPTNSTLLYSKHYPVASADGNQISKVKVNYMYDTHSGAVSSPSVWIGTAGGNSSTLMTAAAANHRAVGHTVLLRAAGPSTDHHHQHTHSEYIIVIVLLVAVFAGLCCVCRSCLHVMLLPPHVDRRLYIELPP